MALEDEVRAQTQSIDKLITALSGNNRVGSTAGGGSSGAAVLSALDKLPSVTGGVVGGFQSLIGGTASVTGAFELVGAAANKINPLLGAFVTLGVGVAKSAVDINESLKTASQNGMYFGQNLGLYNLAIANSRMTLGEFNEIVKYNNQSLSGLAGNAEKSALEFLKLGKRLQDDPLTYDLAATGIGVQEFNKALLLSAGQQKFADLTTKENQDKVLSSAMGLAIELDNVARLTGKNRATMQKEMEERELDVGYRLKKATAGQDELAGILKAEAMSKAYGSQYEKVAQIMATGGPMNKAQTDIVAASDPKMVALISELVKVQGTDKAADAERERIRNEMNLRTLEAQKDTAGNKNAIALAYSENSVAKGVALGKIELAEAGNRIAKDEVEAKKAGISLIEYQKQQADLLAKQRSPDSGPQAAVAKTLNQGEILLKDANKALAIGVDKVNDTLGRSIKGLEGLNTVLRPYTSGEIDKALNGKNTKPVEPKPNTEPKPDNTPKTEKPTSTTPGKEVNRENGSFGAVGKFIEDFGKGTPAMLHGKEGVITENQLNGLLSQATGSVKQNATTFEPMSQMKNMLAEAQGGMKSSLEASKSSMPDVSMFEKMFSQIKMPDVSEISNAVASRMPQSSTSSNNDAMNEVAKGVDQLNMRIERLINAVEDGSSKSVKALKSRGNMIA